MQPEEVRTKADVVALGRALLGEDPARGGGVLHVASAWRDEAGLDRVLRIGPKAPRSRHDRFVLALARARAEAIVTTGKILREEPALTHGPVGPAALRHAVAAWRSERLALGAPPFLLVLSSGRDLDPTHSAFHGSTRPLLFVPDGAVAALRDRFAETAVQIASARAPSLRLALAHLRRLGARRITIEAGPTTANDLYEPPVAVDELWLTRYRGAQPHESVIGEPLADEVRRAAALPRASAPALREEPSGAWSFERRWRTPEGAVRPG